MSSSQPERISSFTELMAFEPCPSGNSGNVNVHVKAGPGEHIFKSITEAWSPGGGNQTFGGHVYAQAIWVASQTVKAGAILCNITGHFLKTGTSSLPFYYTVTNTRDGSAFAFRHVAVYQHPNPETPINTPCFTGILTFKFPEPKALVFQPISNLRTIYAKVLSRKKPEDYPFAPAVDTPAFVKYIAAEDKFAPGVEVRRVDMTAYNTEKGPGEYKQLQFYRVVGPDTLPESTSSSFTSNSNSLLTDPNLAAAFHTYASDRNSLFLILRALKRADFRAIASLSHTVIFHGSNVRDLGLYNPITGKRRWFVQEAWMSGAGEGRGIHESRLWTWDEEAQGGEVGEEKLVATTMQDGMVRVDMDGGIEGGDDDDDDGEKTKLMWIKRREKIAKLKL